ncbi:hypothetical protein SADUNF_Sadunf10G0191300 [Salix dunnii]|uniref:Uncharacterized protein n=1 Tax=Salix dunnii TaxID=1413687 RepID=A0A835MVJ8_9ROSI|nr:hypothetical protein SADUNF_Sadunf10G0191300 [Salix dunnii]
MTEALITSPSQLMPSAPNNNELSLNPTVTIMVSVAAIVIVICYLVLEFCLRYLKYRRKPDHPLDVETGQVSGRQKPTTLSMLQLCSVQID